MNLKLLIKNYVTMVKHRQILKKELKLKTNADTIFVIGDSHVEIFSKNSLQGGNPVMTSLLGGGGVRCAIGNTPAFVCYHLGPCLAYNTNKRFSTTNSLKNVQYLINKKLLPKGCKVLCVFGEIDIRVHIIKQSEKQGEPAFKIVDKILNNYLEFLLFLQRKGYKVAAYGPIATQKDNTILDKSFPRYGTEIERNRITKIFNDKLEQICKENGIGFKTLFFELITPNFQTKEEFLSEKDHVHLGLQSYSMVEECMLRN